MKKVMFISSCGGHLTELLSIEKIFKYYDYVLVTEKNQIVKELEDKYNLEYLVCGSRNELFRYFFVIIINIIKSVYLFFKYNPSLIYTTGTHTCVPMCIIAKVFRRKIIYVEVFDRIDNPTLTLRLLKNIADTIIVQHKEMLEKFPNAKYFGGVF
jgi:UDP-N-acetylglucosamine:LPS N-acetylglucosamine transferase